MRVDELRNEVIELRNTCMKSKAPDWELIVVSSHFIKALAKYSDKEEE